MKPTRHLDIPHFSFEPGQRAVTPLDAMAAAPETIADEAGAALPVLKGVLVYLTEADAIALKIFAAQNRTSIQQLGIEAWGKLFRERGIGDGQLTPTRANRRHGARR
jgi:hypothetical protein